jgi:hypothetical protein
MGPRKIKSSRSSSTASPSSQNNEKSSVIQSSPPIGNFKASPRPILGPKTIRVEVGISE